MTAPAKFAIEETRAEVLRPRRKRVALALGAGGARGLAHVGVLSVLEEEGIPIDFIAGTSMGAVVGAMYAQVPNACALTEKVEEALDGQALESLGLNYIKKQNNGAISLLQQITEVATMIVTSGFKDARLSLLKAKRLERALSSVIDDCDMKELQIPFLAIATDLNSGRSITLAEGSTIRAVRISASVPGFFPPEAVEDMILVDGGVSAPIPVEFARRAADVVIAVSVEPTRLKPLETPHVAEVLKRADFVRGLCLSAMQLAQADITLQPDLGDAHWMDFDQWRSFVEAGREEARRKIDEIRSIVKSAGGRRSRASSFAS
ncbi:MAG TPA: patatin-like phospholipase family protein [Thermosynergistes sp.]|nr:patatin-like phospholipase family protein [Thermosynergistes sp.]